MTTAHLWTANHPHRSVSQLLQEQSTSDTVLNHQLDNEEDPDYAVTVPHMATMIHPHPSRCFRMMHNRTTTPADISRCLEVHIRDAAQRYIAARAMELLTVFINQQQDLHKGIEPTKDSVVLIQHLVSTEHTLHTHGAGLGARIRSQLRAGSPYVKQDIYVRIRCDNRMLFRQYLLIN